MPFPFFKWPIGSDCWIASPNSCRDLLKRGGSRTKTNGIPWINPFFHSFPPQNKGGPWRQMKLSHVSGALFGRVPLETERIRGERKITRDRSDLGGCRGRRPTKDVGRYFLFFPQSHRVRQASLHSPRSQHYCGYTVDREKSRWTTKKIIFFPAC